DRVWREAVRVSTRAVARALVRAVGVAAPGDRCGDVRAEDLLLRIEGERFAAELRRAAKRETTPPRLRSGSALEDRSGRERKEAAVERDPAVASEPFDPDPSRYARCAAQPADE